MKVLSIRQPWAWLIFCDARYPKDVENRTWETDYRGPLLIHAAKGMTCQEYQEAREFAQKCGVFNVPHMDNLKRGGIVGSVMLVDCRRKVNSPWFTGPWGWVLENPQSLKFEPCQGQLGLWEYSPDQSGSSANAL